MKYKIGDKIKFKSEKQRYTIKACDKRFIIATKPFNARKTFLYTIIDLKKKCRGADNYYCRFQYDDETEAKKALSYFNSGKMYSTRRSRIDLDIERIDEK